MNFGALIPGVSVAAGLGLFLYLNSTSAAASTCTKRVMEGIIQEADVQENPFAAGIAMMLGPTLIKTAVEGAIQTSEIPTWRLHWRCLTSDIEDFKRAVREEGLAQ